MLKVRQTDADLELTETDDDDDDDASQGTDKGDKNEILFSRFAINYDKEPEIFKKGSVVFRDVSNLRVDLHHLPGWS